MRRFGTLHISVICIYDVIGDQKTTEGEISVHIVLSLCQYPNFHLLPWTEWHKRDTANATMVDPYQSEYQDPAFFSLVSLILMLEL